MIAQEKGLDTKEKLHLNFHISLIIKKSSFEKNFLHGYKVKVPNSLLKIFLTISGLSSCPNLSINFALLQSMIFIYPMWLFQVIMKFILKRMVNTYILWISDFTYCLKNKLKMIQKMKWHQNYIWNWPRCKISLSSFSSRWNSIPDWEYTIILGFL